MPDTIATNIDQVAPLTWPSVGWKPVCVLPLCNPGGSGIPTATSQAIVASPSLDGAATKFSVTGPAYTNALWVYIAGVNDPATYFVADYELYISSPSFALAQAFEIDMFDFSVTDNVEYMMGTQYNRVLGLWQIWDASTGWVNTSVTVAPTSGGWTHIQQQAHRIPGDLTHVYYDFIVINGVTHWYSGTVGVPMTGAAATLPGGWSSAVGIQYQIDIAAAGSGGTPVEMSIDKAGFKALLVAPATGGGGGGIDNISPPYFLDPKPLSYYISLLTSEYRNAPNINAFLAMLLTPVDDLNACLSSMNAAFDIATAVGQQLDWIGQLVGISRTLPYVPASGGQILTIQIVARGTGYTNGDVITVVQGGASGGTAHLQVHGLIERLFILTPGANYTNAVGLATTGGSGTGLTVGITAAAGGGVSQVLSDADYRILLRAKIAQNQWDGTIDSLYSVWQELFPGGIIIINDEQDMSATIILAGAFSPTTISMISNGLIVPRPEGVQYNYVFGNLPLFGFDRNDTYVAGFDTGNFA